MSEAPRTVFCKKLQQELPGLAHPPMKGELGARIYREISQEAWKQWLKHSTMVINEYRLNPSDPEHQKVLKKHLEDFLFGGGAAPPPEYVPEGGQGEGHSHGGHEHGGHGHGGHGHGGHGHGHG